jgi:(p)ppGpp synthase/HD superfamily hydrolase
MTARLTRRYESALVYAAQLHATQKRKGGDIPYITHLMSVSSLVLEGGGDEDEAIAGLLHDGPEDQGGRETLEEIRKLFGDRVAGIVAGCTDSFEEEKPEWRSRKEAYLSHLEEAAPSIMLVSCADKLHNARTILEDYYHVGEELWERFNSPRDGTLWYYGELARIFGTKGPEILAPRLVRAVEELHVACAAASGSAPGQRT